MGLGVWALQVGLRSHGVGFLIDIPFRRQRIFHRIAVPFVYPFISGWTLDVSTFWLLPRVLLGISVRELLFEPRFQSFWVYTQERNCWILW